MFSIFEYFIFIIGIMLNVRMRFFASLRMTNVWWVIE